MTPHQIDTALYDIRREIALLQRREAALLKSGHEAHEPGHRPGWPMRRMSQQGVLQGNCLQGTGLQDTGFRISTSAPSRMAV